MGRKNEALLLEFPLIHDRSSMTYPTPSHARGKHSKVMQHNHKAFGKSRACSGSLEDHLTCCVFGTVLCREPALAWLREDKNAAGAWRGANTFATNRRAAVHQDRHSRDREQRRVATLLWTHLDATSTVPHPPPSSQVQYWRMASPPRQHKPAEPVTATSEVPI